MRGLQGRVAMASLTVLVALLPASQPANALGPLDGAADRTLVDSSGSERNVQARRGTFKLNFDNGESLRPGTRVRDVTGNRHHATVRVSGRGRLTVVDGAVRRGAGYPSACRRCGRAMLEIGDNRDLDPRRRDFTFGAFLRLTPRQTRLGRDPNIVSKGVLGHPSGQYKLQLVGSRPQCTMEGRAGIVTTDLGPSIDDRRWHRITCSRSGRVVLLRVDGNRVAQAEGAIGRLANPFPVRIGAKAVGAAGGNDQYHGDMDRVFLSIATG